MDYLTRLVISVVWVSVIYGFVKLIGANPYDAIAIYAAVMVSMVNLKLG